MANCKSPGLDEICGFWLKKLTSLHQENTVLNRGVQTANVEEWAVESKRVQAYSRKAYALKIQEKLIHSVQAYPLKKASLFRRP